MSRIPLHRNSSSSKRVATLVAGTNVTITEADVGDALQVTVSASGGGGGGGAPTNASYVVLGTNGTLTDERVLTAGANITITDAGAGSTVTIAATVPTVPTPAASVVAETSFGQSSVVGTSTNYARQDHTHGTPAVPAHSALSTLAWTASGHTGSTTSVAGWNGSASTPVLYQATTDETYLVRRGGTLQWVPVVLGLAVFANETGEDGVFVPMPIVTIYSGTIV